MLRPAITLSLVALAISVFAAESAEAAASRTFVASTGVDTNPCSLVLPCRSFAAAITQTVDGGEIIAVDSAGYGPVTIAQSVSIVAAPGIYAGIAVLVGDGITINAPGSSMVKLRGLTIHGVDYASSGSGIVWSAGLRLRVERCFIDGMGGGIALTAANSDVFIDDTVIHDSAGVGIYVLATLTLSIDHVRVDGGNAAGAYIRGGPTVTIRNSNFARNAGGGIRLEGSVFGTGTARLTLSDSSVSENNSGVNAISNSAGNPVALHVERSTIAANFSGGIAVAGGGPGGTASATVVDSLISGGGAWGILVDGGNTSASATLTASGNKITDNAKGIIVQSKGEFRTLQTNIVDQNGTNLDSSNGGIVTPITGM